MNQIESLKFRILYIAILALITNISCFGQYLFNNVSKGSGLNTSQIHAILKDHEGFIWMGTEKGLVRFDGTDMLNFNNDPNDSTSISEDIIISLFLDNAGNIWAGTRDKGINIIDPTTLNIQHIYPKDGIVSGLSSGQNNAIHEDQQGNIWISSSFHGFDIYNIENNTFTNHKPADQYDQLQPRLANTIVCCTPDPENKEVVWIGTLQGIFKFNDNSQKWLHFPITEDKAENPELFSGREEIVRDILFTSENELWFCSWGGGIGKLNTESGTYNIYKYEPLEPVNGYRNNVKKLVRKSDNELWFAAQHEGLGVININNGECKILSGSTTGEAMVKNPSDIILDTSGNLFVSSYSNGLYYSQLNAHQFNKKDLPFNLISGTNGNNNDFWAGSHGKRGNLIHIDIEDDDYDVIGYKPFEDLSDNFFTEIINSDSTLWLVENFNLYNYNHKRKKISPLLSFQPGSFEHNTGHHHSIIVATTDHKGNIWMGSKFHGIFKVNPSNDKVKNYFYADADENSIKFDEFIFSMFTDHQGRVWYGTTDFGYYDPNEEQFVNFTYPNDFSDSPVILKKIYAFTETRDNTIWLGTENAGIGVIRIYSDSVAYIKSYTQKDGLLNNQIWQMTTDKDNNVWVVSPEGLSRINTSTGLIENYNQQYGLQGLNFIAAYSDDKLFIGARNGYYCFHPEEIKPFKSDAKLYVKSFKIFDEEIEVNAFEKIIDPIELQYNQNFFSIEFGLISYFKDSPVDFQYILEGLDEDWQKAGKRTYLSYTNLKGGNYTLRIKSENANELAIPIKIDTPYWKTWWFYSLIILTIIGLGLLAHLYRLRQIKKQERIKADYNKKINQLEIKALRAQMNPHFLFNSLNSIRYYILNEENENASDYITKFSKLLRLILNNSRQNQISLHDELHALEIYIDFEQMRFDNKFTYEINIEPGFNPNDIQIQPLTIQPFVENAIWHGLMPKKEKGHLKVNVSKQKDEIIIVVEDNGIGRQKAKELEKSGLEESKSFGLKITEDRMNLMESIRGKKSDFKIVDLFENKHPAGTKVIIKFEV